MDVVLQVKVRKRVTPDAFFGTVEVNIPGRELSRRFELDIFHPHSTKRYRLMIWTRGRMVAVKSCTQPEFEPVELDPAARHLTAMMYEEVKVALKHLPIFDVRCACCAQNRQGCDPDSRIGGCRMAMVMGYTRRYHPSSRHEFEQLCEFMTASE